MNPNHHFNLKHLVYRFHEAPDIVKAVMLGLRRISKPSCSAVSMWVALFFLLLPATPLQAELQQSFDHSYEEDFQPSFSIGSPKYKCHRSNSSKPESDQLCHYCYTTWREDVPGHEETQVSLNNSKKITIEEQGCFNYDGSADDAEECNQSHCTNLVTDGQSFQEGHRFCCCIGHYCNHNFTSTAADVDLVEDLDTILGKSYYTFCTTARTISILNTLEFFL